MPSSSFSALVRRPRRVMARPTNSWGRWWAGYVRQRNESRLARHQPAHKPRMQRAARIALWLHVGALLLALFAIIGLGC